MNTTDIENGPKQLNLGLFDGPRGETVLEFIDFVDFNCARIGQASSGGSSKCVALT